VKKILPHILILFFLTLPARAQIAGVDSLFREQDLVYFSELEHESFRGFFAGEPEYLTMIAAINPRTSKRELELYRDWVDEIIANIRDRKFDRANAGNKIERIRKYVSKALLVSYQHEAGFDDLFRFGTYNYWTAASIYAFILDQFKIPYEIYERPTHVFLVAYPGEDNIRIETTRPGFQYFMFDHKTRSDFVEFIYEQQVIDERIYRNVGTRDLFEQYYFTDYGLSLREMIGMLYINSAVKMLLDGRPEDSYAQLEKAFILHPSFKSQYLLITQLKIFLANINYHDPLHLGYLIKASRLMDYGISRDLVEGYLSDIVNAVLVKEEDAGGFEFIYSYIMESLGDEELKSMFTFLYLSECGRMEFNETRYGKALDYFEQAYRVRPDNERIQNLLARSLGGYSLTVSPALTLEKIRKYDTSYSSVCDEGIYVLVKLQTYLSLFGDAFQLQDGKTGEKYMAEFEAMIDANPEAEADHIKIGRAYSSAAIYYYRQGSISKSRQIVERGLEYAPGNIELKLMLNSYD
jgi:tetratricopeptide (TPR) repeat protein